MRDLHDNINIKRAMSPAVQTNSDAAIVSQILDTRGYTAIELLILTGGLTDSNATFAWTLEESDDSGMAGATAIAAANLLGTAALATMLFSDDDKCFKIGFVDTKRYIRATLTPTGNDSGSINFAACWLVKPQVLPTANPPN